MAASVMPVGWMNRLNKEAVEIKRLIDSGVLISKAMDTMYPELEHEIGLVRVAKLVLRTARHSYTNCHWAHLGLVCKCEWRGALLLELDRIYETRCHADCVVRHHPDCGVDG